jgi:hypothetical protein
MFFLFTSASVQTIYSLVDCGEYQGHWEMFSSWKLRQHISTNRQYPFTISLLHGVTIQNNTIWKLYSFSRHVKEANCIHFYTPRKPRLSSNAPDTCSKTLTKQHGQFCTRLNISGKQETNSTAGLSFPFQANFRWNRMTYRVGKSRSVKRAEFLCTVACFQTPEHVRSCAHIKLWTIFFTAVHSIRFRGEGNRWPRDCRFAQCIVNGNDTDCNQ